MGLRKKEYVRKRYAGSKRSHLRPSARMLRLKWWMYATLLSILCVGLWTISYFADLQSTFEAGRMLQASVFKFWHISGPKRWVFIHVPPKETSKVGLKGKHVALVWQGVVSKHICHQAVSRLQHESISVFAEIQPKMSNGLCRLVMGPYENVLIAFNARDRLFQLGFHGKLALELWVR